MTIIAHISDLHFNRVDLEVCTALEKALHKLGPDLLVVSGDLTQRARTREFLAYRSFVDQFPFPLLVVPGNHDVALFNPYRRFFRRLTRFRRLAEPNPNPVYENENVFAIGVDTTRSFTVSGGKLGSERVARIHDELSRVDEKKVRLLVCHHPIHAEPGKHSDWVDGMHLLEERVDLILSGHHHRSESEVKVQGGSTLLVRAGTATSTRHRGETNAYNIIHIENGDDTATATIDVQTWDDEQRGFRSREISVYQLIDGNWQAKP